MRKNILMMAVGLFTFTACNQKEQPANTETIAVQENNNTEIDTNKPLKPVYESYFHLKAALIKGDGKEAQLSAKSLYEHIKSTPMDELSTEEHERWMRYQDELIADAEHIKDTDDIKHQRAHFVTLSKNMFEVIKLIPFGETVYYQNCPMYNENKGGNWLSLEEKIANPYYGSEMLSCGSVVEVIQ